MTDQEIRLKFGEMNAGEMRLARALVAWHEREIVKHKDALTEARQIAESFFTYINPETHNSIVSEKAAEIAALKAERDELDKDLSALLSVLDAHDVTEGVETARYWKQSIKRLMDERDKAQAVVVNEPPKSDVQPDLSGESEKQDPYAWLKAYAKAGARIRTHDMEWARDANWTWCLRPESYEVHPDDLHMVPEYAPQAEPEPATKEAPATFQAHGKTWTRHTPGDPMPCDREANVCVTFREGDYSKPGLAKHWSWDKSLSDDEWIIGWRYADPADQPKAELEIVIVAANEQAQQESAQPTTSPSWTPAVGDTVRLKSGGPVMTVTHVDPLSLMCAWMNASNELQVEPITTLCLEPAQP